MASQRFSLPLPNVLPLFSSVERRSRSRDIRIRSWTLSDLEIKSRNVSMTFGLYSNTHHRRNWANKKKKAHSTGVSSGSAAAVTELLFAGGGAPATPEYRACTLFCTTERHWGRGAHVHAGQQVGTHTHTHTGALCPTACELTSSLKSEAKKKKNYIGSAAHTLPEVQRQPCVYPSRGRRRREKKGPQMIFLFSSKQATVLHDLSDTPETSFLGFTGEQAFGIGPSLLTLSGRFIIVAETRSAPCCLNKNHCWRHGEMAQAAPAA